MTEGKSTGEQYDAHIIAQNQRESENEELAFKAKLHNAISSRDSYKAASFVLYAKQEMLFPNGQDNYFNRVLEVVLLEDNGVLYALEEWTEEYLKKNNNEVLNMLIDKIKKSKSERPRAHGAYTIIGKGYFFDDMELFQECVDIVGQSLEYSHEAVKNWDSKYLTGENEGVFFKLVKTIEESDVYSYDAIMIWSPVYLEMEIPEENRKVFDKFVDSVSKSSRHSCSAVKNWDSKYLTGENDWVFAKLFKVVLKSPDDSYNAVRDWDIMYLSPNNIKLLVDSVSKDSFRSFDAVLNWPEKYLTPHIVNMFFEKILSVKSDCVMSVMKIIKKWRSQHFIGDYQFVFDRVVEFFYEDIGIVAKFRGDVPYGLQDALNSRLKERERREAFNDKINILKAIKVNKRLDLKIVESNVWNNIIDEALELRDKNILIDFLLDTLPKDELKKMPGVAFRFLLEADNEEIMKDLTRGGDYQSEVLKKIERSGREDVMKMLRTHFLNRMGPNAGGLSLKDPGENAGELALTDETEEKEPS